MGAMMELDCSVPSETKTCSATFFFCFSPPIISTLTVPHDAIQHNTVMDETLVNKVSFFFFFFGKSRAPIPWIRYFDRYPRQ